MLYHKLKYISLVIECSLSRNDGEPLINLTIEHASVEIDTPVPGIKAEAPLNVDEVLAGGIVGVDDSRVIVAGKERISRREEIVEPRIGFGAVSHGNLVVRLS